MGLFEKAGRRFEQFKRTATDAAGEEADYECTACGSPVFADADRCPECGAERVVARDEAAETREEDVAENATADDDATADENRER